VYQHARSRLLACMFNPILHAAIAKARAEDVDRRQPYRETAPRSATRTAARQRRRRLVLAALIAKPRAAEEATERA
jgi:hypothetical protein